MSAEEPIKEQKKTTTVNIIQHTKKRFVKPKLVKSESVASCRPADGEFFKTHAQYTPAKVGNRTVHTHFVIETRPLQKNMLYDDNGKINISMLRNHFYREGRLSLECALDLVKQAKELIKAEPNLLTIEAPVIVCGDVHGQFYDLLTIFDISKPIENNRYLFLGDYVDRGDFSCEILFMEPPSRGPMCDILWSDPLEEPQHPETMEKRRLDAWLATDFADNHLRQTSVLYGPRGLLSFLSKNDLICVVRAHQVMEEGFKLHYFLQNTDIPPCITVFSAPNYCDMYQNKASILKINQENICFEQFEYVDHPFNLPDFFDAFSYSLPTMMEVIVNILSELVVAVKEEDESSLPEEEKIDDQIFQTKLNAFKSQTEAKLKEKRELLALKKEIRQSQKMNQDWFDKVLLLDKKNEQKPRRATRPLSARPVNVRTVSETNIIH
ncbi:Serine/threonine-protein phosphatase [Entamoeba marina]